MSLTKFVARMIQDRGSATAKELIAELPEYTEKQVRAAVQNARRIGLIHAYVNAPKLPGVSRFQEARNYPGRRPKSVASPFPTAPPAPPSSVWDLAGREPMSWPPQGQGKSYSPLGSWDGF